MIPFRQPSTLPRSTRAFSIVECAISVVIIGVALVAAVSAVASARQGEYQLTNNRQGLVLAEDLMGEIAAQPYSDAGDTSTVFGPTAAESAPGNRSLFNDVNDYRSWAESPPKTKSGVALAFDATWRRAVQVNFVAPTDPNVASATDQGMAVVIVTVLKNSNPVATLSSIRSAGLPATESCLMPDTTRVNLVPAHCINRGGTPEGAGTNAWTTAEPPDSRYQLISLWTMNETIGTTAADSVGTNNATLMNTPIFAVGKYGNSLKLDGTNEYANVPHTAALSLNSTMTLAAWVYLEAIPGSKVYATVLHKGTTTTTRNYLLQISGGQLSFGFRDTAGATKRFSFGSISTIRRWYHVAATFDRGATTASLYIDGSLVQTFAATTTPATNTGDLTIGNSPYGDYLKGRIDDARIYSRALSAAEINTLYTGGEP